jgi:hypothetical protein
MKTKTILILLALFTFSFNLNATSLEQKRTKRIIQTSLSTPSCSITSTASHIKTCTAFDIQQLAATPAI